MGRFLRKRYKNLIGKSFSAGNVYCRSTDRSRTVDTARCCLTALFNKAKVKHNDIKCYPFSIHKKSNRKDFLLFPSAKCKQHNKLKRNYLKSREVKGLLQKHHSLIKSIEKNTGKKIRQLKDITDIQDTLYIQYLKGFK